ncbi:hypothetical protein OG582_00035 [Streptomyces anulatus]|uniref:hypothetical protein n=1 Tax=Streptomyces anulatus TaxID=1892 RepID=UPI0032482DE7|nr:hypothetical protein OG333_37210 [Streptomyces anulatus]WTD30773.1 hypothetical protein OH737_40145 [Streptomyces anulatus]
MAEHQRLHLEFEDRCAAREPSKTKSAPADTSVTVSNDSLFTHVSTGYMQIPAPEVLAVVAVAPFVTAVATSLGTVMGERIDRALHLLLQKLPRVAILASRGTGVQPPSELPTNPSPATLSLIQGPKIHIGSGTPTDALSLLPTMDFSDLANMGDYPQIVRWMDGRWHALAIKDEQVIDLVWDDEARQWVLF